MWCCLGTGCVKPIGSVSLLRILYFARYKRSIQIKCPIDLYLILWKCLNFLIVNKLPNNMKMPLNYLICLFSFYLLTYSFLWHILQASSWGSKTYSIIKVIVAIWTLSCYIFSRLSAFIWGKWWWYHIHNYYTHVTVIVPESWITSRWVARVNR